MLQNYAVWGNAPPEIKGVENAISCILQGIFSKWMWSKSFENMITYIMIIILIMMSMITKDDDDDDGDKLPARHHAIIKWLVSDFYREWSL